RKNGRLRTLNDNYERRLRVADTTIATQTAELGRLQDRVSTLDRDLQKASQRAHDRVSTLDRDLQKASQRAQAAISQRDQARAAHIATQDRVSAARDTIARLEKRINQVERSQKSRQDLKSALATLQQEKDALAVQSDELLGQLGERFMEVTELRAERDQAQERLSKIASLPRRATREHAPSPSLQPSLPVSPRPLDRLPAFPRLALRVMPLRLDPRSSSCLPWQPARRLKGRCYLLRSLVLLIIFLDLFDRPLRVAAEALRRPLQLLRQARVQTVARALPANPVQLTFLTRTPREAIVILWSRVVPRMSLECHPVLYRTLSWRLCRLPLFPHRSAFPVIAIVAAFAAMTSSPGLHRIFVRPASWRWTRIYCFTTTPSRRSG
ncbi:hypothetical protein L914_19406, partial [Phytophthora nicotianae]